MAFNDIVDQVTREVIRYMEQIEKKSEVLLLTQSHSTRCQQLVKKYDEFGAACGPVAEKEDQLEGIKTVILFDLTNDVLYKLANGCNDTSYLKLASEALLQGKQVIGVKEEIEIFKYQKSAPSLYFNKIMEHLEFLKKCGVVVACEKNIALHLAAQKLNREIEKEGENEQKVISLQNAKMPEIKCSTFKINKRLITEREIQEAVRNGVKAIEVIPKAIITQLAKDSIQSHNILILEQSG
ncbi:hypothetical protein [Cellulosilyticum sp. I15G10I2]|uniref:hypothetical protein n=1 Tax=Cellulosilyticum sp. I15G10I2 TaxID=1892843 RepID=UPI00085C48B8|nr:hypothetical protein [Cellulosilyticum sp. I15G10I2]